MAIIEGTSGSDELVSSSNGDEIYGLESDDMLTAAHNNVTLYGGSGIDVLESAAGADNTTMDGGPGGDDLIGFGTNDTASYANDPAGVVVDLSNFSAIDGTGGIDTLFRIENVTGSDFDDSLTGDDLANVLQGGAGDDKLAGNGGADVFKYSFDLTQGGGETSSFTQFFADHGGTVVGGEVADGTSQGQFSSLYTQWLESLGMTVLDLGQNSGPDGMPVVEVIEGADGTFGERESFTWTSGSVKKTVTHERWYSDTWTSGDGQDSASSGDGFDTIVDFNFAEDKLEFNGLGADFTELQFMSLFKVSDVDTDNDTVADSTMLALADSTPADINWGVTVQGVGHTEAEFYGSSIFS
jgi:Ca2+-binding RTX toxin-like protein